jgi:hypothetical protein
MRRRMGEPHLAPTMKQKNVTRIAEANRYKKLILRAYREHEKHSYICNSDAASGYREELATN